VLLLFAASTKWRSEWLVSRFGCDEIPNGVRQLLGTASVVPSSPILVILMKEALSSSETSVLKRATRLNIPEDDILSMNIANVSSHYKTTKQHEYR
jgi:hypothetical protein